MVSISTYQKCGQHNRNMVNVPEILSTYQKYGQCTRNMVNILQMKKEKLKYLNKKIREGLASEKEKEEEEKEIVEGNKNSESKVGTQSHIGSDNNWTTEISFITPCFVLHNSRANWGKRKSLGNYFLSKLLVFAFIEDLLFGTFLLRMRICLRIVFNGTLEHIVDLFIFHVQLCLIVKDVEKVKINQCLTN